MEQLRKEFYNAIKDKRINPNDKNSRLIMSTPSTGQQLSYDYWLASFFGNEGETKKTLVKLKSVLAKPNQDENWIDRLIPTHKQYFTDDTTFIKSYCCDLSWATNLSYCKSNANAQQTTLDEYVGFYVGKDMDGKDQRQEIKVSGTNLVTSATHPDAGELIITLTPTSTKDVFSVQIQNSLIKSSSGTATFTRNKEGKVCSITSDAKVKPIIGKERAVSGTAVKEGVTCDGAATPTPPQPQNGGQQGGNTPAPQVSGAFPECAGRWGQPATVFLIADKANSGITTFFCDPNNSDKAQADADKYVKDNPTKQLEIRQQLGRFVQINSNFNTPFAYPTDKLLIILKDKTFVSNSKDVHYGTWDCGEKQGNIKITNTINEQDKAKKILKEYFIRLSK